MKNVLRHQDDTLIRLGGDEFLVVLIDISVDDALKVADKILAAISQVSTPDNQILTASIGLVLIEDKSIDIEAIIERADMAMYIAKKQVKSKVYFRPDINS